MAIPYMGYRLSTQRMSMKNSMGRKQNSVTVQEFEPAPSASGGSFVFPWKEEKMAKTKTATYKLIVKDGDTKYSTDKNGNYETKTVDYVQEFDTFAEALELFLGYVLDDYNEDKVSLTLVPAKKKN